MKQLKKILTTTLSIVPFLLPIDVASANTPAPDSDELLTSAGELPWRKARFMVETQTGTRTIGTVDAFVPFMGDDDFLVYANLMAKYGTGKNNANGNAFEGNFGLGFRRVNDSENAIYGAYAFYDSLRSVNNNQFTQATIGAERLGLTWDFRANVYVPFGTTKYNSVVHDGGSSVVQGHDIIEYVKSRTEYANAGADIEVGRTLGSEKLRAYFAMYSFGQDLTGPRLRLEYQYNNYITFTSTTQYDTDRGGQFLLGARFTLGGIKNAKKNIFNRLTAPVVRDMDVVTKTVDTDLTRVALDKVWVVDPSRGIDEDADGTFERPFTYIDDVIESAPENIHIIVIGEENKNINIRDQLNLRQGQNIWGAVHDLYYNYDLDTFTSASDNDAHKVADGNNIRPVFEGSVFMNHNTGLHNLNITPDLTKSADHQGVVINGVNNVSISDVDISGFNQSADGRGISITDALDVSINNVTLNDNYVGIELKNSDVTSNGLTITNSISDGMIINDGVQTHKDLIIKDSGGVGLHMYAGTTLLHNIRFDSNTSAGILLEDETAATQQRMLTITGDAPEASSNEEDPSYGWEIKNTKRSSAEANDGYGIWVKNQSTLTASDGALIDNNAHGLSMINGVFSLSNMQISGNKMGIDYGFDADNNQGSSIINSVIEDNSATGIRIGAGSVLLEQIQIQNNDGHGLEINDGGSAIANSVDVTGNGLTNMDDARTLDELVSGIKIADGTLSATHLNVTGNAGGIAMLKGKVEINHNSTNSSINSSISDNHGYGVYVLGTNSADNSLSISNTAMNNNLSIANITNSGYGIFANEISNIHLQNSTINENDLGGVRVMTTTGDLNFTTLDTEIRGNKGNAGIYLSAKDIGVNLVDTSIAQNNGVGLNVQAQGTVNITGVASTINNNEDIGLNVVAQNKITMEFSDNSHVNHNNGVGIKAVSHTSNTDFSMSDGEIKGNEGDGLHIFSESMLDPPGNSLTTNITLVDTYLINNKVNGLYVRQFSSGTTNLTLDNSTVTGNANGGLYVTSGTITGTKTNATLQINNNIDAIKREGDFIND